MKVFIGSMRAGKTTQMIKQAAKTGAYIICMNMKEAKRVADQAEDMGLQIRFPVTFQELLDNKMRGSFVRNILIDNCDSFLHAFLPGLDIEGVSFTTEESQPPTDKRGGE